MQSRLRLGNTEFFYGFFSAIIYQILNRVWAAQIELYSFYQILGGCRLYSINKLTIFVAINKKNVEKNLSFFKNIFLDISQI